MDSLTQIVLGAACGEVALGKKIGNKALLFGAIGGTIPDLDVFTSRWLYGNEIDIMAAHRGFSHSFVFSIIGAFGFGWLLYKLYERGKKSRTIKTVFTFFQKFRITRFLNKWYVKYINELATTRKDWIWLFFLALFTHPILDSFTPYGTQLFLPFSNYRVAFNNISVVDPFYTLPFLLCLIIAMFFKRNTRRRKIFTWAGIYVSSFYMVLTLINKVYINSVYKASLEEKEINYDRFQTQPTIFNNILWYGIAETEDSFFVGFYSLLDNASGVTNWQKLPKNHNLAPKDNQDIETLAWFSSGYYNLIPQEEENTLRYNDLRYPLLNEKDPNSSVFSFTIKKEGERWNALPFEGKPPSSEDLRIFWERIKGH